jgi:4,5-DOPA dioxygenase extradiol
VQALLAGAGLPAGIDATRGFDHGAWVPMRHLYPDADVPMVQLAMPATLSLLDAATLGAALRPLRFESVLVIGSGSLTHNLHELDPSAGDAAAPQARSFVEAVSAGLDADAAPGANVSAYVDASLAFARLLAALPGLARVHPTLEHLAPLPFARSAAGAAARATRLDGGYRYGALSMHSFVFA